MLAHNLHDVQSFKRHVYGNRLNGIDNEWLTPRGSEGVLSAAEHLQEPSLSGHGSRSCSGAAARPAMVIAWGYARGADALRGSTLSRTAR